MKSIVRRIRIAIDLRVRWGFTWASAWEFSA